MDLLQNSTFWVFVAFAIFAYFAGRPAWAAISKGLDERSERIRQEIEQAEKLRIEAQTALAAFQRKQRDALKEAESILAAAREEADRIRRRAANELEQALARREQQAIDKITQAEAAALQQVRDIAVDLAIAATEKLLTDNLDGARNDRLVDAAIADLPARLH